MMKYGLAVVLGSIRQGRRGQAVADWFLSVAGFDPCFKVTLADLADFDLPLKMEFKEPSEYEDKKYPEADRQKWSDIIDGSDAIVFITPEYNHAVPASLKNAIDQIYWEWLDKPVGFVGYGSRGAADAIDSLRHTIRALRWRVAEPIVGIEKIKKAVDEQGKLYNAEEYERAAKQMLNSLAEEIAKSSKTRNF